MAVLDIKLLKVDINSYKYIHISLYPAGGAGFKAWEVLKVAISSYKYIHISLYPAGGAGY